MGKTGTMKQNQIERFLGYLTTQVADRGVMADLRHGLSRATEYRAWPHVAPWWGSDDETERRIWLMVAAGFAIHQKTAGSGNIGTVLRVIATGEGHAEKGLETFDARFRRLLSCSNAVEVCDHLVGVLRAAERKDVPVNFAQLFTDLKCWGETVKVRWAREYWKGEPENRAADAEDATVDEGEREEDE
jgi:CRISPR type I-E-associated protein CasB/Cse2